METTDVKITIEEYETLLELKNQKQKKKEYLSNYYLNNLKQNSKHCELCDKYVKYNSWFNHLNTGKHLKNKLHLILMNNNKLV